MNSFNQATKPKVYRATGFTLLELMIVIAIAGIVLGLGIPSFQTLFQNNRITTQVNEFVTALHTARSLAVNRGLRVSVCKSTDQASCNAAANWEDGWIVFTDPNNVGTVDVGEEIVRVYAGIEGGNTLRADANFADYISFLHSGRAAGTAMPDNDDKFRLCDDRGVTEARAILVNLSGGVRLAKSTDIAFTCP